MDAYHSTIIDCYSWFTSWRKIKSVFQLWQSPNF